MGDGQLLPTGRFDKILLATDGSDFSTSAEQLALALAKRFEGEVTAMQMVVSNPEYDTMALDYVRAQEEQALGYLQGLKSSIEQQGVACSMLVMHGVHPHLEIIEAAQKSNADLVVMGRRGRRGLARLMVGDATARVVAQSPCKVLVAPRGSTLWQNRILLATDGSRFSDRAGVVATILAKRFNLPLAVVSAVEDRGNPAKLEAAETAVRRVVVHAHAEGVQVTGEVVDGNSPAEAIAGAVSRLGADLVVGGSHGRTGLEKVFLGSVMERVIGLVTCPVLAIKGG